MSPYQLAKVIQMAGGIRSRKRIQKTLHLLQAAGCDLGLDYRMHYYGPYCAEIAELLDRMARDGRLNENCRTSETGRQYDYAFNEEYAANLQGYETTADGRASQQMMESYQPLLATLCATGARVLELASTIVEFFNLDQNWDSAIRQTAEFKSEPLNSKPMAEAAQLARSVLDK